MISYTNTGSATTEKSFKEEIMEKLKLIIGLLSELPVLASTLVFRLGTINLCILFFGWYSFIVFAVFFLLNILTCFLTHMERVANFFAGYRIVVQDFHHDRDVKPPKLKEILYTSYGNIFMFTR